MSTTRRGWPTVGVAFAALAVSVASCAADDPDGEAGTAETVVTAVTDGPDTRGDELDPAEIESTDTDGLTAADVAGLVFMREEEQLAHDVYTALGELWGLRIFENIAASEQRHIEATIAALEGFGIADPAEGNATGEFTDPTLQALHDRLLVDGASSLDDALAVGALIEELDIADLRARAVATGEPALDDLYARLERGSRNHLRAFTSQLDSRGADYVPIELSPEDFEAIVSTGTERGHG